MCLATEPYAGFESPAPRPPQRPRGCSGGPRSCPGTNVNLSPWLKPALF